MAKRKSRPIVHTYDNAVKLVASQLDAGNRTDATTLARGTSALEDAMQPKAKATEAGETTHKESTENKVVKKDKLFNFELVYFKAEDTVFTVIKDWLMVEDSPFPTMFSLPTPTDTTTGVEGLVDTNPIPLLDTSAVSFKSFLCLLYGPRGNPLETYDEWVGALELALRWNFDQVRKLAITGLNSLLPSLGPAARIRLARRFSVGPWLRAGLIDLVTEVMNQRLTREELIGGMEFALDMTTVANVFCACFELKGRKQEIEASRKGGKQEFEATRKEGKAQWCSICKQLGPAVNCGDCRTIWDRIQADSDLIRDIQAKVDEIFGAEIAGCTYNEEL